MTNLFLNYDAHTETITVNTYRNNGYFNEDVEGFIADIADGIHSCCNLEGAVREGTSATPAVLRMIYTAICEYEENTYDN